MSESELLQISMSAAGTLLSVFSLFFGIVSAYIVALYFFLHQAPAALKLLAFLLLSLAFLVLAAMGWNLQYLGEGIHHAWTALPAKATGMDSLGPPLIVRSIFIDGRAVCRLGGLGRRRHRVHPADLSHLPLPLAGARRAPAE